MAIFDVLKKGKKTEKADTKAKKATPKKESSVLKPGKIRIDQGAKGGEKLSFIILKPRITEKASFLVAGNVYTFSVHPDANKIQVKRAMKEMYGVTPARVNMITIKQKKVVVRGKRGVKAGGKKALVYLKKGDKIEFV